MGDLKITVVEHGPLKVEGLESLAGTDGDALPLREGKAAFLCRCGASNNKPFCDGTHKEIGFRDPPEETE